VLCLGREPASEPRHREEAYDQERDEHHAGGDAGTQRHFFDGYGAELDIERLPFRGERDRHLDDEEHERRLEKAHDERERNDDRKLAKVISQDGPAIDGDPEQTVATGTSNDGQYR
jgi:hypothetical protein